MTHTYFFDAPNFYGVLFDSASSSLGPYVEGAPGVEVGCPDKYDQFFQYETKEGCLDKCVSVDPTFSKNTIYGPIQIDVVDKSPSSVGGYVGQPVILLFECATAEPGVTITYQWIDPVGNPIPTATSSIFTFTPSNIQFSGIYQCVCSASGANNWTGEDTLAVRVRLTEALSF